MGWISFSSSQHSAQTTYSPCTPSYSCNTDGTRDNLCTPAPAIEHIACSTGLICSAGACVIPPAPTPNGAGNELKVNPQLVRPGGTTLVTWDISYADTCSVDEDNSSIDNSWPGVSGSYTSGAITQQTTYTLSCTGLGGPLVQKATVYQIPNWKEI